MPIIRTPEVTLGSVGAKCNFFVDKQLWATEPRINVRGWMHNFSKTDEKFALRLLDAFVYFSEPLCDQLFIAAYQGIGRLRPMRRPTSLAAVQQGWRSFFDSAVVTWVTGETPNPTDSGFYFARKARQILGFPEDQILEPKDALGEMKRGGNRPLIFVDDFVGTGSQFVKTWNRRYQLDTGERTSFSSVVSYANEVYYVPLVCTSRGLRETTRVLPSLKVSAAHLIPQTYSAVDSGSVIWPADMLADGIDFLRRMGTQLGLPDTHGAVPNDWQGFGALGLTLAFSHSVPDATLPIYYHEAPDWIPLLRRT